MFALGAKHESVQPAGLADGVEAPHAPGQQLVHVGLVAHVEDELVLRRIEHIMHGDGQLHHAKVWPQVPAGARQGLNQPLTDLPGQGLQLSQRKAFDVRRRFNLVE